MTDTLSPAINRFKDALAIQRGASNPSGVSRALVQAIGACHQEGVSAAEDPAVRLIVHQFGHLCGVWEVFHDLDVHGRLIASCTESDATLRAQRVAA
jgi:hypothetical protein